MITRHQLLQVFHFLVDENQQAIGDIVASDADNDSLSYSISGTGDSAVLCFFFRTVVFQWTSKF